MQIAIIPSEIQQEKLNFAKVLKFFLEISNKKLDCNLSGKFVVLLRKNLSEN